MIGARADGAPRRVIGADADGVLPPEMLIGVVMITKISSSSASPLAHALPAGGAPAAPALYLVGVLAIPVSHGAAANG